MGTKTYLQVTGAIFTVISLLHLVRLIWGWQANISLFQVPMWLSWIAFIVAAWLAYTAFSFTGRR